MKLDFFITKEKVPYDKKLHYLITIPCVNREERNAINVIHKTFESFKKSNMFSSDISFDILLFESGSKDISYLDFIKSYTELYTISIHIIRSHMPLNGISNTYRMFQHICHIHEHLRNKYDYVLWMDDDVFVCKEFIKNADQWIKNYASYSIFSSLYVPYNTTWIHNRKYIQLASLHGFYGTCAVIFKPALAQYVLPYWYHEHFEKFEYNPDTRFRDSIRYSFPEARKICVSFPSLVEHMNIGSAIKQKKNVTIGHRAKYFIGEEKDPELYIKDILS